MALDAGPGTGGWCGGVPLEGTAADGGTEREKRGSGGGEIGECCRENEEADEEEEREKGGGFVCHCVVVCGGGGFWTMVVKKPLQWREMFAIVEAWYSGVLGYILFFC